MDFVVPGRGNALRLVEGKAGRTVLPAMAAPMRRLAEAIRRTRGQRANVEMTLVHQPSPAPGALRTVAPGVRAVPWREFVAGL